MTPAHKSIILTIKALHFGYPNHELFANLNASVPPGVTLVCGGDGRGKSTLLQLMAATLVPTAGELLINGISCNTDLPAYQMQVAWGDPRSDAFDHLTALQIFETQRKHARFSDTDLALLVDGLDLAQHQHKPLFMLSTGTRRKVWLAAVLASNAPVTLLDEPFAALDGPSISFVTGWLKHAETEHTDRAWILGDYTPPRGLQLASVIDLGD